MDWLAIGTRIRSQREYLGYTREQLAEYLGVTPKFCSDIELGAKGMSVPTLCKISKILRLKTDYILFGKREVKFSEPLSLLLERQGTHLRRAASKDVPDRNELQRR